MITDALALAAVELAKHDPEALARVCAILDVDEPLPTLAEAALTYVRAGIAVFPLVAGQKVPRTSNGFKGASLDEDMVAAWWTRWPDANIGFPTGHLFDVIDVDGPPGYLSLADLRDEGLVPDVLARVVTARGGAHLYITPTGDGNTAGLRPGIDYRGLGGYVVAPPSLSAATGRRWTWTTPWPTA
jgi:hypothetical protein